MIAQKHKLLFWPSSGQTIGMGNAIRCISVAYHLKSQAEITFCLPDTFPELSEIAGFPLERIAEQDLGRCLTNYKVVVLDDQRNEFCTYRSKLIKSIFPSSTVISLDNTGSVDKNIDVCINLRDYGHNDDLKSSNTKFYEGLKYFIIRKEFLLKSSSLLNHNRNVDKVLITFGGEDPKGWTLSSIIWLEKHIQTKLNVTVIIGSLNVHNEKIRDFLNSQTNHNYMIFNHLNNIETYMVQCDLAFCSGGSTLMELAFLGKPVIVFPQNNMEISFIRALKNQGFTVNQVNERFDIQSPEPLKQMVNNSDFRFKSVKAGKSLVDGKGSMRISEIILGELNSYSKENKKQVIL